MPERKMKKAIVGFAAVCAVAGFRPVGRRIGRAMHAHCGSMAARCSEMAARFGRRGEAAGTT